MHFGRQPQVSVFFPMIKMNKDLRSDKVSHAVANGSGPGNQGDHSPRRLFGAAVIMRTLPEAPHPILDTGGTPFDVWEIGLEYQRTIAEQPDAVMAIESIHRFVRGNHIGRHMRGSGMKRANSGKRIAAQLRRPGSTGVNYSPFNLDLIQEHRCGGIPVPARETLYKALQPNRSSAFCRYSV